jgi:hypothetical protein
VRDPPLPPTQQCAWDSTCHSLSQTMRVGPQARACVRVLWWACSPSSCCGVSWGLTSRSPWAYQTSASRRRCTRYSPPTLSLSLSLSPTQPSLSSLDHSHSPPPTPPARPLSPLSAAGTGGAIGHCGRCVTQHDHSVRAVQRHQHSGSASRHSQRLGGSLPPVSGTPPSAGPSTATIALRSNCQVRIEVVHLQPHLTSQSVNVRFGKPPPRE